MCINFSKVIFFVYLAVHILRETLEILIKIVRKVLVRKVLVVYAFLQQYLCLVKKGQYKGKAPPLMSV